MPRLPIPDALRRLTPLHRAAILALGLLVLYLAVPRPAPPAAEPSALPTRTSSGVMGPGYLLVLGLLGAGGLMAMKLRAKRPDSPDAPAMESLGQMALGANGTLRLIRCGSETLLLGVTAQQVTLLRTYGTASEPTASPEHSAFERPAPEQPAAQPAAFQQPEPVAFDALRPEPVAPTGFARTASAPEPRDSFEDILHALGGSPRRAEPHAAA